MYTRLNQVHLRIKRWEIRESLGCDKASPTKGARLSPANYVMGGFDNITTYKANTFTKRIVDLAVTGCLKRSVWMLPQQQFCQDLTGFSHHKKDRKNDTECLSLTGFGKSLVDSLVSLELNTLLKGGFEMAKLTVTNRNLVYSS